PGGRGGRLLLAARARGGRGRDPGRAPARVSRRRPLALLGVSRRLRRRSAALPGRSSAVALFVLIGRDGARGPELRARHRAAHLDNLRPLAEAGRIVYAGPLLDDAGSPCRSVEVCEAGDLASARWFAAADRDGVA